MRWQSIERPGFFGKKRDETFNKYHRMYGKENWRIAWQFPSSILKFSDACLAYEAAYYLDSFKREDLWKELAKTALEVYDHSPSDIESSLDYLIQNSNSTHLQDIAIRRVISRRGWKFEGDKLIQIRSHSEYWGQKLSPGRVDFHIPKAILIPRLEGWWNKDSIEDFWQSNKVLQIKLRFP